MPVPATSGWQPFGFADAWAYPFAAGAPGTGFDLPGVVSLEGDPQITEVEHRGDDVVLASGRTLDSIELTLVLGNWDQTAISKIVGGTLGASIGVTPNQTQDLDHAVTDQPPDFGLKAQARSKSPDGGAARLIYPRCQSGGLPSYGFTDQEFTDLEFTISALGETAAQKIATFQRMETYAALTATF